MADQEEFDEMAEACIKAGQLVIEHGTPELQIAARLLLYRLGREIVRRAETNPPADDATVTLNS